jgi:hypothetical protein
LQDALARKAVRGVAGDQEQHNTGSKLRQANQAEIEGTMR